MAFSYIYGSGYDFLLSASHWQGENQVRFLRSQLFAPMPAFDDLDTLNDRLCLRC